jgi:hypothetical protein
MLIVREGNYLTEKRKVTGTDIKKSTLTIVIFHVSLNNYLFVNKGKIFDAQGSWTYTHLTRGIIQNMMLRT